MFVYRRETCSSLQTAPPRVSARPFLSPSFSTISLPLCLFISRVPHRTRESHSSCCNHPHVSFASSSSDKIYPPPARVGICGGAGEASKRGSKTKRRAVIAAALILSVSLFDYTPRPNHALYHPPSLRVAPISLPRGAARARSGGEEERKETERWRCTRASPGSPVATQPSCKTCTRTWWRRSRALKTTNWRGTSWGSSSPSARQRAAAAATTARAAALACCPSCPSCSAGRGPRARCSTGSTGAWPREGTSIWPRHGRLPQRPPPPSPPRRRPLPLIRWPAAAAASRPSGRRRARQQQSQLPPLKSRSRKRRQKQQRRQQRRQKQHRKQRQKQRRQQRRQQRR